MEANNKTVRRREGQSQTKSTCSHSATTSSYPVTVTDGAESKTANGRLDDGSDESLVSPKFSKRAVLNGFGKMTKIDKVTLHVALKNTTEAQSFTFSRTWIPPKTVVQLLTGPLALVRVTFFVTNDEPARRRPPHWPPAAKASGYRHQDGARTKQ